MKTSTPQQPIYNRITEILQYSSYSIDLTFVEMLWLGLKRIVHEECLQTSFNRRNVVKQSRPEFLYNKVFQKFTMQIKLIIATFMHRAIQRVLQKNNKANIREIV